MRSSASGPEIKQGDSIECKSCQMRSYNMNDVIHRYCGNCHRHLKPGEYKIHNSEGIWEEVNIEEARAKNVPVPPDAYAIMPPPSDAIRLGTGILTWESDERRSSRYGYVFLLEEDGNTSAPIMLRERRQGALMARIIEARKSDHVGDVQIGIYPRTPSKGMLIPLGFGDLTYWIDSNLTPTRVYVGVMPRTPKASWMDPRALYDAHYQTVELYFVPMKEA